MVANVTLFTYTCSVQGIAPGAMKVIWLKESRLLDTDELKTGEPGRRKASHSSVSFNVLDKAPLGIDVIRLWLRSLCA